MSRRKRAPTNALTFEAANTVCKAISHMREQTLDAMLSYDDTAKQVIDQLFSTEVLLNCERGFAFAAMDHRDYSALQRYFVCSSPIVKFRTGEWRNLCMLAPAQDYIEPIPEALNLYIKEAVDILHKFALVEYVFDWLNVGRASVGAMSYYCPWIRSCLPAHLKDCIPETADRFREPAGIASMLTTFREVNTIVASAAFLPKTPKKYPECGFTLDFDAHVWTSFTGPRDIRVQAHVLDPHVSKSPIS